MSPHSHQTNINTMLTCPPSFSTEEYHQTVRAQAEESKKASDYFGTHLDRKQRNSIAEQARTLLEGKAQWAPTWQQIPEIRRIMTGQSVQLTAEENRMRKMAAASANKTEAEAKVESGKQSTGLDI